MKADKKEEKGNGNVMSEKKKLHDFNFYCLLFFVLAFIGWSWEVLLHLVTEHAFVNRGVYKGPYLPIYGAGGLFICFLFGRWKKKPFVVFFCSFVLCTVLEYLTSYFLEEKWGIRWWDYSGHFLNINGRVCLLGSVCFGIGGTLLVCLFFPVYERWIEKITPRVRIFLMIVFLSIFITDAARAAVFPNMGWGISCG